MAHFLKAYMKTAQSEGGYSNLPQDRGGETYKGISRKYNPKWEGWSYIDEYRTQPKFPSNMGQDCELELLVINFYKNIWDYLHGDEIKSQLMADRLFDIAVNMGYDDAIPFMQRSLNVLNKQALRWPDLIVDGKLGPKTVSILTQRTEEEGNVIAKVLLILQGYKYITEMENDKIQEIFAWGWLNRITII